VAVAAEVVSEGVVVEIVVVRQSDEIKISVTQVPKTDQPAKIQPAKSPPTNSTKWFWILHTMRG
jgi:hypothetical protein